MGSMIVLRADKGMPDVVQNPIEVLDYDKGRRLQDFYDALKCDLVEVVWDQPITLKGKTWNLIFLGDEEGLLKQTYVPEKDIYLPPLTNYITSFIRRVNGVIPGYERVVGDVAVIATNEERDFIPLTDAEAAELLEGFTEEYL